MALKSSVETNSFVIVSPFRNDTDSSDQPQKWAFDDQLETPNAELAQYTSGVGEVGLGEFAFGDFDEVEQSAVGSQG